MGGLKGWAILHFIHPTRSPLVRSTMSKVPTKKSAENVPKRGMENAMERAKRKAEVYGRSRI